MLFSFLGEGGGALFLFRFFFIFFLELEVDYNAQIMNYAHKIMKINRKLFPKDLVTPSIYLRGTVTLFITMSFDNYEM